MEMQCTHRRHHHPARLEENPLMVAHAHPVIVNRITEHAARERDLAGRQDTRRSRHPSLFLRRVRDRKRTRLHSSPLMRTSYPAFSLKTTNTPPLPPLASLSSPCNPLPL